MSKEQTTGRVMAGKHTQGLLAANPQGWLEGEGGTGFRYGSPWVEEAWTGDDQDEETKANIERLAQCWNACADIPNPSAISEVVEALKGLRWKSADRDNMEYSATVTYSELDKIRAALAKLEGRS
jgi:hypothetical protein